MKTTIIICFLYLQFFPLMLSAQKNFIISGEIDQKMNSKRIKLYQSLPAFSIFMPSKSYECIIMNGKFSFEVSTKGHEMFTLQLIHHGDIFNSSFNTVSKSIKISFLDTLLKQFIIEDDGFDHICKDVFEKAWLARGNSTLGIKIVDDHIRTPYASALLFWLVSSIPESEVVRLYTKIPKINRRNTWSVDLQRVISKFKIGKFAIDFAQQNPEGKMIRLEDYRGKYVLLDFWASWCLPCRKENPAIVKAYHVFRDKGFEILSVSLDTERNKWIEAIKKDSLIWTHVSDLKGWENNVSRNLYNVTAVPQNYLIDPDGKIIAKNLFGAKLYDYLSQLQFQNVQK